MPITHQAPFGTMGTIHASDPLKQERGMSRLEDGAWALGPGPWADLWFLRDLVIPEGGTGQPYIGQTSRSSQS